MLPGPPIPAHRLGQLCALVGPPGVMHRELELKRLYLAANEDSPRLQSEAWASMGAAVLQRLHSLL